MGGALAPPFEYLVYICAASGFAGVRHFWEFFRLFLLIWDVFCQFGHVFCNFGTFFVNLGIFLSIWAPVPGAEISIFCDFRRRGHVKYSVLGLPGLQKTTLLKP